MKIILNGEQRDVETATLSGVLDQLGFGTAKVATALNGNFVPASARSETFLTEGDRLEVVAPMQGG